ncbi:metallophosphoesterase [Bacillus rubiinfantis]|uniref:metallophosphoesterase n=1 Tax=Bacillus rubiinfantis TaxID=1499680 RepID=UPI0005A61083|nr:metallophosphoesterase [Bacillus rubiinfantis]
MVLIIGIFVLYNCILCYIGWNGWKWIKAIAFHKRIPFAYVYLLVYLIFAYSFVIARFWDWLGIFTWMGAIWLGMLFFLCLSLPVVNLLVWLSRFTSIEKWVVIKWSGLAVTIGIISLFIIGIFNAYSPVVRTYNININKPVSGKNSMKIVMASDLHFGKLAGAGQAAKLAAAIKKENPDLVLLPGDIIDDEIAPFLEEGIPNIFKKIQQPIFAVLGNHDRERTAVDLIQIFNNSGMKVLDDETIVLENGVTLVGRRDRGYQDVNRKKLAQLMSNVDKSKPVILLDHQPYDLVIAADNGVDLMLSGHTHRGQIAPGNLITKRLFENDWGYVKRGKMQSIVSSGYGFWGTPLRIGTRSEIVVINIHFKP